MFILLFFGFSFRLMSLGCFFWGLVMLWNCNKVWTILFVIEICTHFPIHILFDKQLICMNAHQNSILWIVCIPWNGLNLIVKILHSPYMMTSLIMWCSKSTIQLCIYLFLQPEFSFFNPKINNLLWLIFSWLTVQRDDPPKQMEG